MPPKFNTPLPLLHFFLLRIIEKHSVTNCFIRYTSNFRQFIKYSYFDLSFFYYRIRHLFHNVDVRSPRPKLSVCLESFCRARFTDDTSYGNFAVCKNASCRVHTYEFQLIAKCTTSISPISRLSNLARSACWTLDQQDSSFVLYYLECFRSYLPRQNEHQR